MGKTSVACAAAVHLARQGSSVLLVSTDPASNVGQVFGVPIGDTITPIPAVPGLSALEIDPEQAAAAYRERISCPAPGPTSSTPGGEATCLGPLSGLDRQRAIYAQAVAALQDPTRTRMVLVARAHASALREIERTNAELTSLGIAGAHLVINAVLPAEAGEEDLARAIRAREAAALAAMPPALAGLSRDTLELKAINMVGIPALEALLGTTASAPVDVPAPESFTLDVAWRTLGDLVDELTQSDHALVMCMGKGGVGKTTIAAAIAVALARRGHPVHLTTTDPAAHLDQTLQGTVAGLTVSRIDPAQATREYRERVMATKGRALDDAGRAALAEDLRSPCTEEVAVFTQFSKAVSESRRGFVVVDTAPTGHTLLLLDAAGSYHREVARQFGDSRHYTTPLMHLQDPDKTKVLLITLAEPTPVLEALELQADLQRAGIHPWAWIINSSLAAARPQSPFLRRRARAEIDQIAVAAEQSPRLAIIPALAQEPIGEQRLADLTATWPSAHCAHA